MSNKLNDSGDWELLDFINLTLSYVLLSVKLIKAFFLLNCEVFEFFFTGEQIVLKVYILKFLFLALLVLIKFELLV